MPVNSQKKSNLDSSYFINNFYAIVKIKNIDLLPQNILVLNIRESLFDGIPVLELSFLDNGDFSERFPLEDQDEISLTIGVSDKTEPVIEMTFQLQDFKFFNMDGDNFQLVNINLTGIMKNKDLFFPLKTRAFSNKPSLDVLSSIASECGFSPKVKTKTSDVMTWRQLNQTNYQMIYETMKRAFRQDDAILTTITRSGEFVITSLNTELKNKTTKKLIYDPFKAISSTEPESESKSKEYYFNNFSTSNISGNQNKSLGYGLQYSYYDLEDFKTKKITSDFHPLSQFSFKRKEDIGKISKINPTGILNNLNVHRNYFEALAQNEFYVSDFFKGYLLVYINPTNDINVFDKFDIVFPAFDNNEAINSSMSGEYLCGSISFQISKDGIFRMMLALFRNGMNGSPYMKKSEMKVS